MAEVSYPFTTLTAAQWRTLGRYGFPEGVINWFTAGYAANNLKVVADTGSNMNVRVLQGEAIMQGTYYNNNFDKTLTITSNATGSTRIDRVYLGLNVGPANIAAAVKVGSTTAPALNSFEIPLAQISVPNGATAIATGNITDERRFTKIASDGPEGYHAMATQTSETAMASTSGINFCTIANVQMFAQRRYKLTGHVPSLRGGTGFSGNGGVFQIRLYRSGSQLASVNVRLRSNDPAAGSDGAHLTFIHQYGVGGGMYDYNLQIIRVDGNGEASIYAGGTSPATLLIEDIGSSLV